MGDLGIGVRAAIVPQEMIKGCLPEIVVFSQLFLDAVPYLRFSDFRNKLTKIRVEMKKKT